MELRNGGCAVVLVAGQAQSPVLQADAPSPVVVSVILSRRDEKADADQTSADVEIVAVVEVGCGGVRMSFELDWASGVTFSVVADTVTVNARYEGADRGTRSPSQVVQAAIAVGVRASGARPVRTVRYGLITNGTAATRPVPERASSVQLLTSSPAGYGLYSLAMELASAGNTLAECVPAGFAEVAPLPLGVRAVTVANGRGGAGSDRITLVYGLDV